MRSTNIIQTIYFHRIKHYHKQTNGRKSDIIIIVKHYSIPKDLYFEKSFKTKNEIQELPKNIISTVYSIRQIKDKINQLKYIFQQQILPKKLHISKFSMRKTNNWGGHDTRAYYKLSSRRG